MVYLKPLFTTVLMCAIIVAQSSAAVFGNGLILAVIARFKSLRTVPNLLIANLALVDLLSAAINMPIHMISTVLQVSWYRGQLLAIMTSFFSRFFVFLNLASMLALLAIMYFAIAFDLKYYVWKSNLKAVTCSCLIWFICTVFGVLSCIPLLSIDLGDAPVTEYRREILKERKHFIVFFVAFFVICATVLGVLTVLAIRRNQKQRAEMNLPALQAQARLKSDIKMTKTIAITVVVFFICYVPGVVYAGVGQQDRSPTDIWFSFLSWLALYFSSATNPIIYYLRTNKFRSVFKQFMKDPIGSSHFKENPRGSGEGRAKPNVEGVTMTKKDGDADSNGPQPKEIQIINNYHGQRRSGLVISAIQALEAHLNEEGGGKQQRGNAVGSNSTSLSFSISRPSQFLIVQIEDVSATTIQAQKSDDRGDDEIKVNKEEALETKRVNKGPRKGKPPVKMNAHLMSGSRAEVKLDFLATGSVGKKIKLEEILGRRRNAITPALQDQTNLALFEISEETNKGEEIKDMVVVELE